ncbi:MAG: DUF2079 domain-containing protein [Clostridia bacterium]|nr:DUF2079 domain-containing protein [Clostridia bacterium]
MKKKLLAALSIEKLIQRFIAVWCCINLYTVLTSAIPFTDKAFAFNVNPFVYVPILAALFVSLSIISATFSEHNVDSWAFALGFAAFTSYTLTLNREFWYCMSLIVLAAIALNFLVKDDKLQIGRIKLGKKVTVLIVSLCALFIFGVVSAISCLRYATYSSPNFDFGIWCNMFHHMKEGFLPIVSSERDKLLSHFAVHISPIYYLLLPLYCIFPSPYTLQISQGIILAGGIIPFYLLARHKGLSNKVIVMLSIAYAFSPALICGTTYDLHENCFLVPLLLWMFYFFEKGKYPLMYLAAFGVCMIKEDACLFVLFFGIFLFLSKKKYLHGIILAVLSAAYFGLAMFLLTKFGDGVLSDRFNNYMYEDNGLVGMVRIILADPAYVFTQTLKPEKLVYLLKLLLPLGFLPLATKKVSHFVILLPFMLINLMTDYEYQFSIDFQYSFGAAACLMYLAVINAKELGDRPKKYMSSLAAVAAVMIFLITAGGRLNALEERYKTGAEEFATLNSALETLPEDASVKASTFFIPHIAARDEVYEIRSNNETDYVVFDMRPSLIHETDDLRVLYAAMGYSTELDIPDRIMIMKNPRADY